MRPGPAAAARRPSPGAPRRRPQPGRAGPVSAPRDAAASRRAGPQGRWPAGSPARRDRPRPPARCGRRQRVLLGPAAPGRAAGFVTRSPTARGPCVRRRWRRHCSGGSPAGRTARSRPQAVQQRGRRALRASSGRPGPRRPRRPRRPRPPALTAGARLLPARSPQYRRRPAPAPRAAAAAGAGGRGAGGGQRGAEPEPVPAPASELRPRGEALSGGHRAAAAPRPPRARSRLPRRPGRSLPAAGSAAPRSAERRLLCFLLGGCRRRDCRVRGRGGGPGAP